MIDVTDLPEFERLVLVEALEEFEHRSRKRCDDLPHTCDATVYARKADAARDMRREAGG